MGRAKKTTWGDAEGRRRDILAAAKTIVEKHGKTELNMRDVALKARVSPGTLYVYFKTKEEIFLTLYATRVEAFSEEVRRIAAEAKTFEQFFENIASAYLAFYREYGHGLNVWALVADPAALADLPAELAPRLRGEVLSVMATAAERARELASKEKRGLTDDPHAMPFVWTVLTGLAENFSGPRAQAAPYDWNEMVRFAARTLRAGLTEEKRR